MVVVQAMVVLKEEPEDMEDLREVRVEDTEVLKEELLQEDMEDRYGKFGFYWKYFSICHFVHSSKVLLFNTLRASLHKSFLNYFSVDLSFSINSLQFLPS